MCWCAPTTHRWSLISTAKEVCACAPCTGWCAISLSGLNMGVDVLLRQGQRPGEWMLHPNVQLITFGLSTEVVETILQSRAPSARKLYALKWRLFTSWCRDRQLNPVNCVVGTVLEFLQARLSTGLTHSTLKVKKKVCGSNIGLPRLSWWTVSWTKPPGYTFPPRCAEAFSMVPCAILRAGGGAQGSL